MKLSVYIPVFVFRVDNYQQVTIVWIDRTEKRTEAIYSFDYRNISCQDLNISNMCRKHSSCNLVYAKP